MTNGAIAAAAGSHHAAEALRASGAIIVVEPVYFMKLLEKSENPLVVHALGWGFFSRVHQYLTGYKGLVFHTKSAQPLRIEGRAETIESKKIWIPGAFG